MKNILEFLVNTNSQQKTSFDVYRFKGQLTYDGVFCKNKQDFDRILELIGYLFENYDRIIKKNDKCGNYGFFVAPRPNDKAALFFVLEKQLNDYKEFTYLDKISDLNKNFNHKYWLKKSWTA